MMTARLFVTLALVLGAVVIGELVGPSGWRLSGDLAQVLAGTAAAWSCLASAGRHIGVERRWRRLAGAGLLGWTLMQAGLDDSSAAFLILPLCVLLGLLTSPYTRPRAQHTSPRRDQIALLIDSVLIAGSLLALAWSAIPARAYHWAGQPAALIGTAATYPIADLLLLTMVVLLLATRPGSPGTRRPLRLIGLAALAFGVTDTLRLLHLADLPLSPLQSAGHVLGPALLAVAAATPAAGTPAPAAAQRDWLHLLLPYVPVTASGIVIAISTGAGNPLSPFEAYLGWLGLGLVVARQMFTIVDNTVLLGRVSEAQRRLHHQAYHDPLTGLANRALFRERLVRDRRRPLAVLFIDLDDFKLVNDSFGHAIGDRVLRAIAERLQACVGSDELVARLGGDEFAVLLDQRPAEAEPAGHRILAALREPFLIDGHRIGVGASIGLVAPEPGESLTVDALLRRADAAMYASKRRGKGTLARYAGAADADVPHLLAQALVTDGPPAGFEVHYQPIVRLTDGATVAVEALARWTSAAGPVHPDVFVTVAERTGQVAAIDDFVLDQACADASRLAAVYGHPVDVHVNVSAARLGQDDLLSAVRAALSRHRLPADRLVVEITETHRIPDLPVAAAAATRLRETGVRIALDDFGSGFNALAQLHALPLDIVKLDSTLTGVEGSGRAAAVCRSILAICAEMSIVVVGEGIETPARAAALAGLGCPLGQGYLYGQPAALNRLTPPSARLQQLT
jgi:diguanylate cyclase (GGDEF)-like protein